MERVVTAAEMRAVEEQAAAEGLTSPILMERAGKGAARAIARLIPAGTRNRAHVVVLCGPGNNGGDGLVVARELTACGIGGVCAYTYNRKPGQAPPEPSPALARVRTYTFEEDRDLARLRRLLGEATIVVDALLGTGRARPIEGDLAALLEVVKEAVKAGVGRSFASRAGRRPAEKLDVASLVVALDLPTGLNADTGALDEHTLAAGLTLTFGFPKRGLLLEPGTTACGRVIVIDIGLGEHAASGVLDVASLVWRPRRADVAAMMPPRDRQANKYSAGAVLVVAGSPRFAGAPRLAALGAARTGAGLVTVATGRTTHPLIAGSLVEMTFLLLADDPDTGALHAQAAVEQIQGALSRYRCVLVGPGLGQEKTTQATVRALAEALRHMAEAERPRLLVDADGLNALAAGTPDGAAGAGTPERFWELLPREAILTPHAGEMGRLRRAAGQEGGSRAVEADRLEVARAAARDWGHVVVLKGARTVITAPDGRVAINCTGGPNLATAGTGDVLGGIIAGLAAQGCAPFEAAVAGVYLHGAAGDRLARRQGDRGTLAGDLPAILPETLQEILHGWDVASLMEDGEEKDEG